MRKRWMRRFIQYYLRRECLERLAKDHRKISEVFDKWRMSKALYFDYERHGDISQADYWRGFYKALGWVLKVEKGD